MSDNQEQEFDASDLECPACGGIDIELLHLTERGAGKARCRACGQVLRIRADLPEGDPSPYFGDPAKHADWPTSWY